jgi:hypothetical protein
MFAFDVYVVEVSFIIITGTTQMRRSLILSDCVDLLSSERFSLDKYSRPLLNGKPTSLVVSSNGDITAWDDHSSFLTIPWCGSWRHGYYLIRAPFSGGPYEVTKLWVLYVVRV